MPRPRAWIVTVRAIPRGDEDRGGPDRIKAIRQVPGGRASGAAAGIPNKVVPFAYPVLADPPSVRSSQKPIPISSYIARARARESSP